MKPHDVSPASGPRRAKQGHVGRGALALHPNGKNGASAAGASGGRLDEKQILVALTALKKGMRVQTVRNGSAPADTVQAFRR